MAYRCNALALMLMLSTTAVASGAQTPQPWVFFSAASGQQMVPSGINGPKGIAGTTYDISTMLSHGFLRTPDGTITAIDVPGAVETSISGINANGDTAGFYGTSDNHGHGFVRDAAGAIQSFDISGAILTEATAINNKGVVAGFYYTGTVVGGFLRKANGTVTTFAPPSTSTMTVAAVDEKNQIAGSFVDTQEHGFFRSHNGTYTVINVPGAIATAVTDMNVYDQIIGTYQMTSDGGLYHGFVRAADGTITTFDISGPGIATAQNTKPAKINYLGQIVGCFQDASNIAHGFVRDTDGTLKQLDAPGATNTCASAIGADGKIVGYTDTEGGFRLNRSAWKKQ